MRLVMAAAILIGSMPLAFAGEGFDLVIPGRPGVPIIINGIDVSYAVLEGDFGLGKAVNNQPTVFGGRYVGWDPPNVGHLLSEPGLAAGLWAPRDRAAHQPQVAAAGRELSSILVGGVCTAAGAAAAGDSVLSAAGDLGAAQR
jgi:hypothetical protein